MRVALPLALLIITILVHHSIAQTPSLIDVYTSGEDGYMCIRIPVIVETPNYLLAFAEARGLHSNNFNCCITPG